MAKTKVYEFHDVEEFVIAYKDTGETNYNIYFSDIQNEYNCLIARGCKPESIRLNVFLRDSFGNPVLDLTWCGTRTETQSEYAARIESYERRSAAAKGAVSKRKEREIAKARKEITEAQETIQKLTEKFGISILTD